MFKLKKVFPFFDNSYVGCKDLLWKLKQGVSGEKIYHFYHNTQEVPQPDATMIFQHTR